MTEVPATPWWAIARTLLLTAGLLLSAVAPVQADPPQGGPGAVQSFETPLPEPELGASLLKSQRKDTGWRQDAHYAEGASGPQLNGGLLDPILDRLTRPDDSPEPSFFERLENWLNTYFGNRAEPVLPDWLRSYRLPEDTMLWVFYISCALIVVLAIAIIVNEVRHARGRRKVTAESNDTVRNSGQAGVADGQPASLLELPAWLLNRLIRQLGLGLADTRGESLTHRELILAGKRLPEMTQVPLTALSATAERIRYGGEHLDEGELAEVVAEGRALLHSLEDGR